MDARSIFAIASRLPRMSQLVNNFDSLQPGGCQFLDQFFLLCGKIFGDFDLNTDIKITFFMAFHVGQTMTG
jgi:hypothetical protein